MWDKPGEAITIKVYPLTLAGFILMGSLTLGTLGILGVQLYLQSSFNQSDPLSAPVPSSGFEPDPPDRTVWSGALLTPPIVPAEVRSTEIDLTPAVETPPLAPTGVEGNATLRVGNQTPYPVRIAFLQRTLPDAPQTDTTLGSETVPDPIVNLADRADLLDHSDPTSQPVHWDFEPGEGGYQGLILSLPQGDLDLETGDVLVAFAQDGSRRYWGPYVVGETPLPYWNEERSEWQLLLQP